MRSSSSGLTGEPTASSSRPAASLAATGAKMSRPWNVADSGLSQSSLLVSAYASLTPPSASAACISSPLSGPTKKWSPWVRKAIGRRGPPTPGSTTARITALSGMYGSVLRSTTAPASTSRSGRPWVTSMTRTSGASRAMTPRQTPAKSSV